MHLICNQVIGGSIPSPGTKFFAAVAQLGVRLIRNQEVGSSILSRSTIDNIIVGALYLK